MEKTKKILKYFARILFIIFALIGLLVTIFFSYQYIMLVAAYGEGVEMRLPLRIFFPPVQLHNQKPSMDPYTGQMVFPI